MVESSELPPPPPPPILPNGLSSTFQSFTYKVEAPRTDPVSGRYFENELSVTYRTVDKDQLFVSSLLDSGHH